MNLEQLKNEHPSIYAEFLAQGMAQGIEQGVKQERARICSALPNTSTHPRERYMLKNIREGKPLGNLEIANYLAMQIREARGQDHDAQLAVALE